MKQVNRVWLPDAEQHFANSPYVGARYPVMDKALSLLPSCRRRTAVDVGAHIGLWSKWLVQEFERVEAFEPVKEYADIFRANVPGNNWFMHKCALGSSVGRVAIKKYPENTGQAHISGKGSIDMWPLDSFAFRNVDLIKIDVEGYELHVVEGAVATLRQHKPIVVIEQRGCDVINFGVSERDLAFKRLLSLGMKLLDKEHYDLVLGWE